MCLFAVLLSYNSRTSIMAHIQYIVFALNDLPLFSDVTCPAIIIYPLKSENVPQQQ